MNHDHHAHSTGGAMATSHDASCCAGKTDAAQPTANPTIAAHAHHGHAGDSPLRLATAATLHCLTGCAIGEVIGLMIGVSLGLPPGWTMALATTLAYISGFSLGLWPLVRHGMSFKQALRTIWLGEAISIAVMEIAMNFTDYHMGGMSAPSILHLQFWSGLLFALPAGFIAAWPVNWWLLKRNLKKPCH